MFKKMTIKVHHDKDSKNSKSIRLLGGFFWAPILQRNKILKISFSCETLGLKWTMCISASNCFPSTVCSLPRPCREPQWACISKAWLQKFKKFKSSKASPEPAFKSSLQKSCLKEIHLELSWKGSSSQAASFLR